MRKALLVLSLPFLTLQSSAENGPFIRYYPPGSSRYAMGSGGSLNGGIGYTSQAFDWFVDSVSGNDGNDGKSPATAFQTLGGLLGETITAGQLIGFARGSTFRELFTAPASNLTLGSYGSGVPPVISAVPVLSTVAEETGGVFASGLEDETDSFNVDFASKVDTGGALSVVDGGRTGAKSMRVVFNGTLINAYAQKPIAAQTDVYARCWLKVDKSWAMSGAGQYANVFSLYDTVNAATAFRAYLYSITPADASPRMLVQFTTNGGGVTSLPVTTLVAPEIWHSVEIHWVQHATTGGVEFYFDGRLLSSDLAKNTTPYAPNTLVVGGFLGLTAPPNGATLYYDDIKLSATGPLGDSVTRREYAIDLDGNDGVVIRNLDLADASVTAIDLTGATGTAKNDVRSMSGSPWVAPSDPTPATTLTQTASWAWATGGAAITDSGVMFALYAGGSEIRRSTDNGANWTTVKTFPDAGLSGLAMFVDSRGYIHAFPSGGASTSGIWTSTDGGTNWSRNLDTSAAAQPAGMWGVDEDADGRVFAGLYTSHAAGAAGEIYRSTNGVDWSKVYDNDTDRHVHAIAVDQATGYVYAAFGDNGAPWNSCKIMRSTDNGDNWTQILNSIPQMTALVAGSGFRLLGTDTPGSAATIYRTTDDVAYTSKLRVPRDMDCLWTRTSPDTGYIYAGFGGATVTSGTAGIWRSKDSGLTWDQVVALPITAAADGTGTASNIVGGKIIVSVVAGGTNVGGRVYSVE